MMNKRTCLLLAAVTLCALLAPASAEAGREHIRDKWYCGVGFGFGRGAFKLAEFGEFEFKNGAMPQMRFGHSLGSRFALGAEYTGWMVELGNLEDKARSSQQAIMLALTWYPGKPTSNWGGFYLRASGGLGWSRFAAIKLNEELEQVDSQTLDESGLGLQAAIGYEWRIGDNVSAGFNTLFTHLDIGGDFYEEASYGAVTWVLNYYW